MRKKLIKVMIFIIIIGSIQYMINQWFTGTIYYQNILISRETVKFGINETAIDNQEAIKFDVIPETIKLANFGSSHGRASFDYSVLKGTDSFNFGLSSQTLTYDYKLLNEYKGSIECGAVLIFPITYITLYKDELSDEDTFESLNTRYYDILAYNNMIKPNTSYYLLNKISPFLVEKDISIFEILEYKEELSVYNKKWYTSMETYSNDTILEMASSTAKGHKDYIPGQTVNSRMEDAVVDIINLCEEEGYIPIFLTPPFTEEYNDAISEEYYSQFNRDIEELIINKGAIYFDYSHDSKFTNNYTLFSDPDHLNQEGAKLFTEKVIEDIEGKLEINID